MDMSVIVTDMETPSGCWCCEFGEAWDNESSLCKRKPMESPVGNYEERPLWCPIKKQEAEWIYGEDETGVDGWRCSECGFFEPWFYEFTDDIDFIRFYGFCPSCGRKMTSYTGKPEQESR